MNRIPELERQYFPRCREWIGQVHAWQLSQAAASTSKSLHQSSGLALPATGPQQQAQSMGDSVSHRQRAGSVEAERLLGKLAFIKNDRRDHLEE
eukprot:scaffold140581_cov14-Tisochrysis_lutea.AAC.1